MMDIYSMKRKNSISLSSYLFSTPSFINGTARLLDLGCSLDCYRINESPQLADKKALMSNWIMIGNDIRSAIYQMEKDLING